VDIIGDLYTDNTPHVPTVNMLFTGSRATEDSLIKIHTTDIETQPFTSSTPTLSWDIQLEWGVCGIPISSYHRALLAVETCQMLELERGVSSVCGSLLPSDCQQIHLERGVSSACGSIPSFDCQRIHLERGVWAYNTVGTRGVVHRRYKLLLDTTAVLLTQFKQIQLEHGGETYLYSVRL